MTFWDHQQGSDCGDYSILGEGVSWTLKEEGDFTKEGNPLGYLLGTWYMLGDRSVMEKGSVKETV